MAKVNIVRKITMKSLVGIVGTYAKDLQAGQSISLARFVGIARGIKTGTTNYGEYQALTGEFVAEALAGEKVGNRYRSGTLFLPNVALDLVTPAVNNIARGEGIEMAFEVGIERDTTSAIGYVYTANFLMEPAMNDPLEQLVSLALPSPETEPEKEKEPATKK